MTYNQRARFIPFNIGNEKHYIDRVTDKVLNESEFNELINSNREKDIKRGYQDRLAGYYDKWYRYNRLDEGAAYDEGQRKAVESKGESLPYMNIIPCMN